MQCSHCGRETVDQASFCNYCGERVAVACPSCERLNPPDSVYCHGCGRNLTEVAAESQEPAAVAVSRAVPAGVACPRCGAANEPASTYCYQCGLPLEGELDPAAVTGLGVASAHRYRSARKRAIWTSVLLAVTGLAIAFYMGTTAEVLDLRQQFEAHEFVVVSQMAGAEEDRDDAAVFFGLAFIATAVAFLMWTYRAARNLPSLGSFGQRFSPRWAVGWWFVPVMFFFRPYQVAAEIWKGSAPDSAQGHTVDWKAGPVSPLLAWWWALWIASNIVGFLASFAEGESERSIGALQIELLGDAVLIAAAALAVAVVWRTTKRQDERHRRIMAG
jgi:hypothetical protein